MSGLLSLLALLARPTSFNRLTVRKPIGSPHLDGVRQGDGDCQREAFRDGNHQDGDADDEELDEELDVDGRAVLDPGQVLDPEGVDHKQHHQDYDGDGRHDQACGRKTMTAVSLRLAEE